MPYPVPPPPPPPLVTAPVPEDARPSVPVSSQGQQATGDRAASALPQSFLSPPERFPSEPFGPATTGGTLLIAELTEPTESPQEAVLLGPPLQVGQPADLSEARFGMSTLNLDLEVDQFTDQDVTIYLQQAAPTETGETGEPSSSPGRAATNSPTPADQVRVEAGPQADPAVVHQVRSAANEASPELTELVDSSRTLMVELFRAVETGQIEGTPPDTNPTEDSATEDDATGENRTGDDGTELNPSEVDSPVDLPGSDLPETGSPSPGSPDPISPETGLPDPTSPDPDPPAAPPTAPSPAAPGPADLPATDGSDAVEVTADRQIYDQERRSFLAEGNAVVTFREAVLQADRVQVNIPNRIAVAEGNVVFVRGEQILRGDRIEYNLVRQDGTVLDARGEVFIPQAGTDLDTGQPVVAEEVDPLTPEPSLSERLARDQPPVETATTTGGLTIGVGVARGPGAAGIEGGLAAGTVRQLRFEADRIDFRPGGWEATGVRVTNDPFSPPELEIRSNRATFTRLSDTRSELRLQNPRLVFDQRVSIPLLRERYIFDQRQRDPLPFQFGFDEDERGGFYVQTTFEPIVNSNVEFTVIPQFFLQRAIDGGESDEPVPIGEEPEREGFFSPDNFGVIANLDIEFDPKTTFGGNVILTSFDLDETDDELRGSVRVQRQVLGRHTLTTEFSYRDRLFNGTLGFQTVQRTYGAVLTSPIVRLGNTGIELTYQAGIQRINANITGDRQDELLPPIGERENSRATLTRYQLAAEVRRFLFLWIGTPLPATPDEGLRYTPAPVVPYIGLLPRVRGLAGFYSSGDTQPVLTGEISLFGQFGHFSRPAFDYLGFNLTYRHSTEGSESPFDFDRIADRRVLSGGATVQLIGPLRIGFQTSISLDNDEGFDTSYILEYSRRTYGIVASYNPDREIGTVSFRLSDFTWTGIPEPFDGAEPTPETPPLEEPNPDIPADEDPTLEDPDLPDLEDPDLDDPDLEDPTLDDLNLEAPDLEDPDLEDSTFEDPDLDDPDLEDPTLEDSNLEEPILEDSTFEDPDLDDPNLEDPTLEDSNLEEPILGDPELDDATLEDDATLDAPDLEDSTSGNPTQDEPSAVPSLEPQTLNESATDSPPENRIINIPVINPPSTPSPSTDRSATEASTTEALAVDQPITHPPATHSSATHSPTTHPPIPENSASNIPAPESPAVEIPVIEPITAPSPTPKTATTDHTVSSLSPADASSTDLESATPPQSLVNPFPSPGAPSRPAALSSPLASPFLAPGPPTFTPLPSPPESP
ncbi:MAG: DUF3769 domain-containing protein [Synechococcales bacterium]|nr:DUF3769 domain-containing protein [Synechococcales bacterium]